MCDPTDCLSVTDVGISLKRRLGSACRIKALVTRGATFKVHKKAVFLSEARNDWSARTIAICAQSSITLTDDLQSSHPNVHVDGQPWV
jgi:hypothetical protein